MEMSLQDLCDMVEQVIPTAIVTPIPEMNQVLVGFTNRPDVEIALLTPYHQTKLRKGRMDEDDVSELLFSLCRIAAF